MTIMSILQASKTTSVSLFHLSKPVVSSTATRVKSCIWHTQAHHPGYLSSTSGLLCTICFLLNHIGLLSPGHSQQLVLSLEFAAHLVAYSGSTSGLLELNIRVTLHYLLPIKPHWIGLASVITAACAVTGVCSTSSILRLNIRVT